MSREEKVNQMEATQPPSAEQEEPQVAASVELEAEQRAEAQTSQLAEEQEKVRVIDRRRFTPEGEPIAEAAQQAAAEPGSEELPAAAPGGEPQLTIEQMQVKLKEAESKREEAERQVRDYAERFRHAQAQLRAETEELRLRLQRNFEQKLEASRGEFVMSLLEVLDNLKRAVEAAEASQQRSADFDSLLDGVRATAEMFEARMRNLGLTPVPSEGELFNPEIHEAVEMVSVPPEQDNHVITELQSGYKLGDRLLRPARVRVGRASD